MFTSSQPKSATVNLTLQIGKGVLQSPSMEIPDELLTLNQVAEMAGVTKRTLSEWCSPRRHISRRLRAIRYSHKTVRVRRSDWLKFQEQMAN